MLGFFKGLQEPTAAKIEAAIAANAKRLRAEQEAKAAGETAYAEALLRDPELEPPAAIATNLVRITAFQRVDVELREQLEQQRAKDAHRECVAQERAARKQAERLVAAGRRVNRLGRELGREVATLVDEYRALREKAPGVPRIYMPMEPKHVWVDVVNIVAAESFGVVPPAGGWLNAQGLRESLEGVVGLARVESHIEQLLAGCVNTAEKSAPEGLPE